MALPERPMIFHVLISSGLNSNPRSLLARMVFEMLMGTLIVGFQV